MNDWNNQSARNIARALRDGVLTSEELTGEMLARIRNRNPALNAVIHLDAEQAMEQARPWTKSAVRVTSGACFTACP